MEYRGYDSAGLEIEGDGRFKPITLKSVGKVASLEKECFSSPLNFDKVFEAQTSIAHTRWATHGVPSSTFCSRVSRSLNAC